MHIVTVIVIHGADLKCVYFSLFVFNRSNNLCKNRGGTTFLFTHDILLVLNLACDIPHTQRVRTSPVTCLGLKN